MILSFQQQLITQTTVLCICNEGNNYIKTKIELCKK